MQSTVPTPICYRVGYSGFTCHMQRVTAADAGEQKGDETSASLEFESTAGNAAEPSNGSQDGRHEEEEESQQAEDDEHGSLLWSSQHAEEEEATPQIQGHEDDASADDPQIEAELRATNASSNVVSHLGNRAEQTLSQRPGSGMMDEYLKRMHWSRSSPLPTQSSNTGATAALVSLFCN